MKFATIALLTAVMFAVAVLTGCNEDVRQPLDAPIASGSELSTPSEPAASADDGTFEPEMLGIVPGADISEIRFTWYSSGSSGSGNRPAIRLYNESGALVTGLDSCWSHSAGSSSGKRSNKCVVRGLTPGTEYQYSVSHNGSDWSYRYGYKTSAGGNVFKFAAVADPQLDIDSSVRTEAAWRNVMSQIVAHGVDFVACAGDQVDAYMADEREYAMFFAPPELRSIALSPAMGNHESNNTFHYHFNLPNASTPNFYTYIDAAAANYWFMYNNILFVVPNTGLTPMSGSEAETHVRRYDSLITAAKERSAGKYDWLIVKHHRSTRSIGPHAALTSAEFPDTTLHHIKAANFEAVMDKHGVDLVLAGHEHLYTRTHPLKDNRIVADGEGTVYLTLLPAASTKFYPPATAEADWEAITHPARTSSGFCAPVSCSWFSNQRPGYAMFDVNGATLSMTVYDIANTVIDRLTLSKAPSSTREPERVIPPR